MVMTLRKHNSLHQEFTGLSPESPLNAVLPRLAISIGIWSWLMVFIIGSISFYKSICVIEQHIKDDYLARVSYIANSAGLQKKTQNNEDIINAIRTVWDAASGRQEDEYLCVFDSNSTLLYHSNKSVPAGEKAPDAVLSDSNDASTRSLHSLISRKIRYVGTCTATVGNNQIAAILPVPESDLTVGIFRSREQVDTAIFSILKPFSIGFIIVGALIIPLSLLVISIWIYLLLKKQSKSERTQRLMHYMIENIVTPTAIISPDSRIAYANKAACEMLGYTRDELTSLSVPEVFPGISITRWAKAFSILRKRVSTKQELMVTAKNGARIPAEAVANHMTFDNSEYMIVFAQNITERKLKDEEIARVQQQQKAILDTIPDIAWLKDKNGIFLAANEAYAALCGHPVDSIPGCTEYDLWPEELAKQHTDSEQDILVTGECQRNEGQIFMENGDDIWIETIIMPIIDEEGILIGTAGIGREMTDRKKAENELRAQRDHTEQIIHNSPAIICSTDAHGITTLVNPAGEEITGYTHEELVGKSWWKTCYPDMTNDQFGEFIEQLKTGPIRNYEMELTAKNGKKRIILWNYTLKYSSSNTIQEIIGFGNDITERREIEEELMRGRKLDSLAVLAGGIAHDFNNALTSVLGYISLSKLDMKPETLSKAEAGALRAKTLSEKLLTFSRGGAPIIRDASITDVVNDAIHAISRFENVTVECTMPETLSAACIDKGQMRQVIVNILTNAVEAMPDGGKISVSAVEILLMDGEFPELSEGAYIKLSIADQGTGIAEENLPKIFDPFFTTKQNASGLGLSSSYSIIKKHHGLLTVKSTFSIGTIADIYIPCAVRSAQEPETPVAVEVTQPKTTGKQKHILVMDDEAMIRELLKQALEHLGYNVEVASDGKEAVESYKKSYSTENPFDAVIMDLTVPGGMGGKDAFAEILKFDPTVTGIVASGYSKDPVMSNYHDYGFKAVIPKPFKINDLQDVVSLLVNSAV